MSKDETLEAENAPVKQGQPKTGCLKGNSMDEKFIEVKQLYKTFHTKKQDIEVLRNC